MYGDKDLSIMIYEWVRKATNGAAGCVKCSCCQMRETHGMTILNITSPNTISRHYSFGTRDRIKSVIGSNNNVHKWRELLLLFYSAIYF